MKIHKVSFQNLNSLVGRHEIDLSAGPLADAGIFAITGPTGAGKSTILDAITLALYGRAARYDSEPNPADMMSRHTGECSAEVVFEVPAGRFRATWHLNRARKKHDGKVQPAKRCLYDADELPIAERINDVNFKVDELVGLDMNRFLRSALLAQNQFAQFLRSNPNDRSVLLEKLTGTDVYSRLGKLAHEMYATKERELTGQMALVSAIQILSPEDREEIEASVSKVDAQIKKWQQELLAIDKDILRGDQLAAALTAEKKAEDERAALTVEKKSFASVEQRLTLGGAARAFSTTLTQIDDLSEDLKEHASKADSAEKNLSTAQMRLSFCGDQVKQFADKSLKKLDGDIESLASDRNSAEQRMRKAAAKLKDNAVDKELAAAMGTVGASLARLGEARRLTTAECNRKAELEEKRQELQQETDRVVALIKLSLEEKDRETSRVNSIRKQLTTASNKQSAEELQSAINLNRDAGQKLSSLLESIERRDELIIKCKAAEGETGQIRQAAHVVKEKSTEIGSQIEQQKQLVEALRDSYQRGKLVARLHEHRPDLESGTPCPLCGSLEHPYTTDVPITESSLVSEAKKLKVAEQKCGSLEKYRVEILADLQRQESEAKAKEAEGKLLSAQRDELQTSIKQQASDLKLKSTDHGSVASELSRRQSEMGAFETQIAAINKLAIEFAAAEKSEGLAIGAWERQKSDLTSVEKQLAVLQTEVEKVVSTIARCEVDLATHADDLAQLMTPFLPADGRIPESGKENEVRRRLQQRVNDYTALTEELEVLKKKTQQFQDKESTLTAERKNLVSQRSTALELIPKSVDFGPSLFSESSTHQSINAACKQMSAGWNSIDDALEMMNELAKECMNAAATVKAADGLAKNAQSRLNALRARLETKITGSDFGSMAVLRSAILSDEEFVTLTKQGEELEGRIHQNAGQLKQVAQLLGSLRKDNAPGAERLDAKREEKKKIDDESRVSQQRLGGWRQQLVADDKNRKQREDRGRDILEQEQQLESWRKMRNLIGSADGSKFRRFAQGLTLDLLVRLANRHLEKLSERYRLQRIEGAQLDLEISDLHQGGTARPMKSLSGGESFIASLALALGLADLAGRNVQIDSLFIDEGFGSLDPETLDVAVSTLEGLQSNNKTIGVISHVELLKERISTQIRVRPIGGGVSKLEVVR